MGEVAEMMLNGTLCEGCGCFIDEDGAQGFPRYCSERCATGRGASAARTPRMRHVYANERPKVRGDHACPAGCGMSFKTAVGASQHARAKHGDVP